MKCRPHLKQNGEVITDERLEGTCFCGEKCPYYEDCLVEFNGGNERIAKLGLYTKYTEERKAKYHR